MKTPWMVHTEEDCGPAEPAPEPKILPSGWKRLSAVGYRYRDGLTVLMTEAVERDGKRWRHVSVSAADRLPTWDEMVAVKEIFIGTQETALQLFPPRKEWVNEHPHVLHLWHCLDGRPVPDFRRQGTL